MRCRRRYVHPGRGAAVRRTHAACRGSCTPRPPRRPWPDRQATRCSPADAAVAPGAVPASDASIALRSPGGRRFVAEDALASAPCLEHPAEVIRAVGWVDLGQTRRRSVEVDRPASDAAVLAAPSARRDRRPRAGSSAGRARCRDRACPRPVRCRRGSRPSCGDRVGEARVSAYVPELEQRHRRHRVLMDRVDLVRARQPCRAQRRTARASRRPVAALEQAVRRRDRGRQRPIVETVARDHRQGQHGVDLRGEVREASSPAGVAKVPEQGGRCAIVDERADRAPREKTGAGLASARRDVVRQSRDDPAQFHAEPRSEPPFAARARSRRSASSRRTRRRGVRRPTA